MILKFGAVVEDVRVDAWTSLSFLTVFFFLCVFEQSINVICQTPVT